IPARPRRLMLMSAFVYLTGALGFEMAGGWYGSLHNDQIDLVYEILSTFEESLEMIGLVTFIHALMIYIETVQSGIAIQIGIPTPESRLLINRSSGKKAAA